MKQKARTVPEVTDVDLAFGNVEHLPPFEEVRDEFWNGDAMNGRNKWVNIAERWFYQGLPADTDWQPKKGVDGEKAVRAIGAILRSYAPKHQHKIAGCAALLRDWFDDVKIPEAK